MNISALIFNLIFPKRLVSRCDETNLLVPQGGCSPGRCWPVACEDSFEGDEYGAPAGGGATGRGENDADGLCMTCRIRWWTWLQAVFWRTWTLWWLVHDVGRMLSGVIC